MADNIQAKIKQYDLCNMYTIWIQKILIMWIKLPLSYLNISDIAWKKNECHLKFANTLNGSQPMQKNILDHTKNTF